jgi:5'-methylthioadenosine phosphorylase
MIAIIGGTGVELSTHPALRVGGDEIVATRWGQALVTHAQLETQNPKLQTRQVLFLHRHADPATKRRCVPPHRINYRANIAALKKLGATAIFASSAVGSLRAAWKPGSFALLDQFMDFTTARDKTFFDERALHIDVTEPYCSFARAHLRRAAARLNIALHDGATYLCADGPRFETPAEIRLFQSFGADVVGMTGVPEVVLAREAEIAYAGVSIVTNLAAGISPEPLTQAEVLDAMKSALPRVIKLFLEAAREYAPDASWPSRRATREFATTDFEPNNMIVSPSRE